MVELGYTLAWPRPLFEWEAARVEGLGSGVVVEAAELLVSEAFEDESARADLKAALEAEKGSWTTTPDEVARGWLATLCANSSKLVPPRPAVYFAERQGLIEADARENHSRFASSFVGLINDFQEAGYFPRALPQECVDDTTDYADVSRRINRMTRLDVQWPPPYGGERLTESTVLTLIEYFHDHAQRPRIIERMHSYCGPHFGLHNRESGGVVYRWRMNQLLETYGIPYRLGATGEEKGRLIRVSGSPIDELADGQMRLRAGKPDEVAHAISEFRRRGATAPQKRSAIRALSHALEPQRKAIAAKLSKKDESDLFFIANAFGIRHNKDDQRVDYGEEFLDWAFWVHLAAVDLLDKLGRREKSSLEPSTASGDSHHLT